MSDSKNAEKSKTNIEAFEVGAEVRGERKVRPWNAILWKGVGEIVAFIPSYRDTREGRKKGKQMRVLIVGLGIGLMAIGGTADQWGAFWILLGIFLACMAFVAPVEELKKRGWRGTIKKKQKPRRVPFWTAGSVRVDDRHVTLRADGERVRRVRIDRGKHELRPVKYKQRACLGVLAPGGKASEGIWIVAPDAGPTVDWKGEIDDNELDRPAKVSASDWEKLWQALSKRS